MNLEPLLQAPIAVQFHVGAVVPAAMIGPWLFCAPKGTPMHRITGKVWLGLMVVVALSSFFIHESNLFMGFGPIHLISIYVLAGAWMAYRHARARRIAQHKRHVIGLYLGGIVGAGLFTLLPGRIMHDVVFMQAQEPSDVGPLMLFLAVLAVCALLMLALVLISRAGRVKSGTH
ncbi:DUF2306 domain-containing protein [Rhizobium sp. KVB221]|uniref:DUF2306 domain-containing protein n=2 Tax=Rhizobium setariae TaxID=2801340 RepID=A0A936YT32_9HYPH|nr:DUF2306 domain-containing protein [Rhizobium setariae]MBL0371925.1 DUF2306 domain-containing protein [Rhizobium setariae]